MKNFKVVLLTVLCVIGAGTALYFHDSPALFMVGTIELILIALVVNGFVLTYSRRNWRANPYGRAMMYSKLSLAILCNMSLLTLYFGEDWQWRAFLRVILFGGILLAQARLLQLLFSIQNRKDRKLQNEAYDERYRKEH